MKIQIKAELGEHQHKALHSDKYNIFMGCGVGSGKTHVGSIWSLKKLKESHPESIGIIAANSYPQLIDSTLRNVFKLWSEWGIDFNPKTLPKTGHPFSLFVKSGKSYKEILCRSLDTYKKWSGMEINWAWLDETWDTPKEAIEIVDARLRDDRSRIQMLMTTTLDDPSTWMYDMIVEKYNPELMDIIYATTHSNQRNLPDDYIERLKSRYTEKQFERMVLAKWVFLDGMQIYYAFSRDNVNADIAEYDPNLPIRWTHDFNIGEGKPMSSALCQIKKHGGKPILTQFDELILESTDTNKAVLEYESRDWIKTTPKSNTIIYGDSSGRSRDTRSNTTDYGIIGDAGFTNQIVPTRNPSIRDRHNAVNALMKNAKNEIRYYIHPRCGTAIKGFETVKLKKGANYLEEETYSQHVTTAIGYLVMEEFPIIQNTRQNIKLAAF